MASLRIGFWNIHGHKSRLIGNKLTDPEFIELISDKDIIGLGEIHSQAEVSLPGFISKKQKIREKKSRGPKLSGGIGVFVREEISHLVRVVENKNPDSIWVRIKNGHEGKNDLFLGTYYVSPDNKNHKNTEFFHSINEEIVNFSKRGPVMIQGDLNGRTGEGCDFVESDKFDSELGIDDLNREGQGLRNSEDKTKNQRGKEILDLCKLNDLLILNGRTAGDIFGNFTCHNWNGSSVVDYCIISCEYIDNVTSFTVGEYIPWLSDHCAVDATIRVAGSSRVARAGGESFKLHPGFLWNDQSYEKYKETLSFQTMKDRVDGLLGDDSLTVAEMAEKIKSILFENADMSGLKTRRVGTSGGVSEPWFDGECKSMKDRIRSIGKQLAGSPGDRFIRSSLCDAKKSFRRKIAYKKRNYKRTVLAELESKRREKNHKDFWKIFRKISPKRKHESVVPSMDSFFDYFKGLSVSSRPLDVPEGGGVDGPLDSEISLEELEAVSKKTKRGKAVGLDYICNEMLIALVTIYPKLVLNFFNAVLRSGEVLVDWTTGLIVPIYKDGPKLVPSNYRGITLSSCLSKLFLAILNNRLTKFVKDRNLLTPSQLGFVLGNRPSDAHIIIYNLVRRVCHGEGSHIFSCFVDFKKAFDSIPRDVLLRKLLDFGITGRCFNILKHIYSSDRASIKSGNSRSGFFDLDLGVRQGCILSPLLFNLFLSDLAKRFESMEEKIGLNHTGINSLFWADDLVLFARSKEDLDKMLKILEEYCKENEIAINTKKTKCMIFNKTGRLMRRPFYLNGTQLEVVRSYKYLGFVITPSGEILTGLQDLRDRAYKAFMKLKYDLGSSFNQDVLTTLSLIDTLIKPIILYASDFWGCLKMPSKNPVQKLLLMIYRQLLGVQKQTADVGVLLELGTVPLSLFATKLAVKNWERIRKGRGNGILVDVFKTSEDSWDCRVRGVLDLYDMSEFYVNEYADRLHPFIYKKLFGRMSDGYHDESFKSISEETSKLRTYALFKTDVGLEPYLLDIKGFDMRSRVTKFRLSNHHLRIETGRRDKIPKHQRFCPFCPAEVEDEHHFLFVCPAFRGLRQEYIRPIVGSVVGFETAPKNIKTKCLMSKADFKLYKFISMGMDLRAFLTSNFKNRD